ncbi:MAG TPA: glucose-6-phosphate dehydrogenase assembly protein OpcA [Rariglobus sp.]|nr:glucose-6-phosphate dehydrogenase assembly protein OpcA [Rariglobus sp.]
MSAIFNALPGIEVPVGSIKHSLTSMWAETEAKGGAAPSSDDAKATQVNFVMHLGLNTTAEDAVAQFQTAVAFSRRYPCRVVVLCPMADDTAISEVRAKIYGECHLGKSKGDTRCCEFVMLTYSFGARSFIENQVSICLSTDLPLYYWAHRFVSSARISQFHYLLSSAKRVLLDSALLPEDALTFPWPRPEAVRDLAYARLLPVRQTLGQFLSAYEPAKLVDGLSMVKLRHQRPVTAEAAVLLGWLKTRFEACGMKPGQVELSTEACDDCVSFDLAFTYSNASHFHWSGDLAQGSGHFEADFGTGRTVLPTAVSLLKPEAALGEAMFF